MEELTTLTRWFGPTAFVQIPDAVTYVTSSIVVVCVVVACCNATNLMDGLDGLCGGVTAVIAAGFLFLAVHLAMSTGAFDPNLDAMRVVIAIALLGAVLGFIPYNFNPASIFMGDTGSMFLGFCCATMILLMSQGQHWRWFLASMVMFALPVLDTATSSAALSRMRPTPISRGRPKSPLPGSTTNWKRGHTSNAREPSWLQRTRI